MITQILGFNDFVEITENAKETIQGKISMLKAKIAQFKKSGSPTDKMEGKLKELKAKLQKL